MWETRKYGGWRTKGTRLADFGMVECCQDEFNREVVKEFDIFFLEIKFQL